MKMSGNNECDVASTTLVQDGVECISPADDASVASLKQQYNERRRLHFTHMTGDVDEIIPGGTGHGIMHSHHHANVYMYMT